MIPFFLALVFIPYLTSKLRWTDERWKDGTTSECGSEETGALRRNNGCMYARANVRHGGLVNAMTNLLKSSIIVLAECIWEQQI